ncbi:MAG: glycosyltransferase [Actinomycetota bacterium]|nr:glycosyltransferase [Actinomycetota bacterium]
MTAGASTPVVDAVRGGGPSVDVVIPTLGRPTLAALLDVVADVPGTVFVVDDRPDDSTPLVERPPANVRFVRGRAAGPAAARNAGWTASAAEWIAFVDDDVQPPADWPQRLLEDLRSCGREVGATQGRITVPLPQDRRPTDWERNVAGLQDAAWATADMAYRRAALQQVGGFDEGFPRAYREDADLALRVRQAGWQLVRGSRQILHPVRPAPWWISVRLQRGNADDPLMRALHGRDWRRRAEVPRGRRRQHLLTVGAGLAGVAGFWRRSRPLAVAGVGGYAAAVSSFAWRRISPGPRNGREVAAMVATSAVLPFAATYWWLRGWATLPARLSRPAHVSPAAQAADAVPGA